MFGLGMPELMVIVVIALVVFGARDVPRGDGVARQGRAGIQEIHGNTPFPARCPGERREVRQGLVVTRDGRGHSLFADARAPRGGLVCHPVRTGEPGEAS
jgi:hypothetical protein